MIVVDSSVWIEFLRGTESRADRTLSRLIAADEDVAVTEVVVMEILAGARSDRQHAELRSTLHAFPILVVDGLAGYEAAADLYRACRDAGEPVRALTDCLVAVPAIDAGATVLALDADFEKLARHTPLRLESLDD